MTINEKILQFLSEKKISITEIAKERGVSTQAISQLLKKKNTQLDFVLWLVERNPEIDLNLLLRPGKSGGIVAETKPTYENSADRKAGILKELDVVLDKYL
jgi:hypothetical protein